MRYGYFLLSPQGRSFRLSMIHTDSQCQFYARKDRASGAETIRMSVKAIAANPILSKIAFCRRCDHASGVPEAEQPKRHVKPNGAGR